MHRNAALKVVFPKTYSYFYTLVFFINLERKNGQNVKEVNYFHEDVMIWMV